MSVWTELKPEGTGPVSAWRVDPSGKPRGGIVVIQEIFGVNAHIRSVAERFAGARLSRGRAGDFRSCREGVRRRLRSRFEGARHGARGQVRPRAGFCATSRRRSRSRGRAARSGSSAFASAARSRGWRRRARRASPPRSAITAGGIVGAEGPEAARSDPSAFRREGCGIFRSKACGRSRPPIPRSRSTSTRPATPSIATPTRPFTTRRARRSPGRARWRSSASIWGSAQG